MNSVKPNRIKYDLPLKNLLPWFGELCRWNVHLGPPGSRVSGCLSSLPECPILSDLSVSIQGVWRFFSPAKCRGRHNKPPKCFIWTGFLMFPLDTTLFLNCCHLPLAFSTLQHEGHRSSTASVSGSAAKRTFITPKSSRKKPNPSVLRFAGKVNIWSSCQTCHCDWKPLEVWNL